MIQEEKWILYYTFKGPDRVQVSCSGESDGIKKLAAIERVADKSVEWAVLVHKIITTDITEYLLSGEPPVDLV